MKGAEILIQALEREGVEYIFGYPGGAIMPVYDALLGSKLKHILTRHEQGAALAADGYARVSGKVGVCMATSGPGATNLVTGIANAFLDSVPLVAITGQVPTNLMGTDAFQEVDIFGITMPIVKHNYIVRRASEIASTLREAFELAASGRPGPVLIDLPKDVTNEIVVDPHFPVLSERRPPAPDKKELQRAMELLKVSTRPLLYIGGGVRNAGCYEELRAFVETGRIPAVSTLQGLGSVPGTDELFLGMLGMHGMKCANNAVQECDLLLAVGARFDDRATGKLAEFAPHAKVIHFDADSSEIGKLRRAECSLVGDIRLALVKLTQFLKDTASAETRAKIGPWLERCIGEKKAHAWRYDAPFTSIYAPKFLKRLSECAPADAIISCDVGQHQMWVAQHYAFNHPNQHLTSGSLGTMGFGLPAALGAQLAAPDTFVVTISGDGSIMMNIQELATIKRYNIPVKIVLFDNKSLGMVRQWQELFFAERYSEVDLSDNPDFARVAEAFGIPALTINRDDEIEGAITRLLSTSGPLVVHVLIDPKENVWPLVPPGKSNSHMMEARPQ